MNASAARLSGLLASAVLSSTILALPAGAQNVGVSAAVNQTARGTRPNAAVRTIVIGDNVVYNERIDTDGAGLLQILLADGTTFTVGPNSGLSIDRFVYDPNAGTAEVSATLTKGVFRFIGGKTSKTPGGVSLNTPVGTIGIRGAMADMRIGGSGGVTAHFDLKFGKELTLTGADGRTERVYQAGYSVVVTTNADGSQRREIRRTPPGFANEIQQALSGAPGTNGGSTNQPTDGTVLASRISTENSDRPPAVNAPPIPTARPDAPGETDRREEDVVQNASTDVVRETVVERTTQGPAPTAPTSPGTGPVSPVVRPYSLRLLTAGTTYDLNNGTVESNPGAVGLVGGSAEEDRVVVLGRPEGSGRASGATNRGELVLPVYDDAAFTIRSIPLDGQASLGGIALGGILYSGADGFAAYALGLDGDATRPVYALTGTPLADPAVFDSGEVRTYAFYPDLLQGIPVPFTRRDALGADYSTASISDFYVLESDGSGILPVTYQSWLLIDGAGPGQRSGVGVNVGTIDVDGTGAASITTNRRGTFRSDTLGFSTATSGTVTTVAGPSGGSEFFGSNGQYFVLSGDSPANDYFTDTDAFQSPAQRFSTAHVLSLTSEVGQSQFLVNRGTDRTLAATTPRTMNGYAAGLIEVGRPDGSYDQVLATSSAAGTPFFIEFRGNNNTLGGSVAIQDRNQAYAITVPFGNGTNGNTVNGNSAYIDDNLFAATNNNRRSLNTVTTRTTDPNTSAVTTTTYRQREDNNPRTYLVSGDANPQTSLMPNGRMCDCSFLEWGWWGTQLTANDVSTGTQQVRAGVHLGTWVAGDIATTAQLAPLAGTSATYTGRVVGNVSAAASGGGIDDYVASGAMSMSYDFGPNTGSMTITGFDNRDFAGAITGPQNPSQQGLYGTLQQTNLAQDAQGSFAGDFVNDGSRLAAGVIGNIDLSTTAGDWAAVGIAAGARP